MANKGKIASMTMAEALAGLQENKKQEVEPAAAEQEKPKRRRKSIIERRPLPEPKQKRTRRKKDPALKKTHTFTLLLTEQMYEMFKATAEQRGLSMNGIASLLIKRYITKYYIDPGLLDDEDPIEI